MDKLFALKNIQLQTMVDWGGLDINLAYTDKLLEKNILIEFYTVITSDDPEPYEVQTAIFVRTLDEKRSYSFELFCTTEVARPLILFRIIADAVAFIENCEKETLLEDLEVISTDHTTSDDSTKTGRKEMYEDDVWKFKTAFELIEEKRRTI